MQVRQRVNGAAEPARQLPEVNVKDEARLAQRPRAEVHDHRDIQSLEDRVDADAVAIPEAVVEPDGAAIDENEVDLGMGDAARLDLVLDRRPPEEGPDHVALPVADREKVVQLGVEAKGGGPHQASVRISNTSNATLNPNTRRRPVRREAGGA